jgi:hypothetical protein
MGGVKQGGKLPNLIEQLNTRAEMQRRVPEIGGFLGDPVLQRLLLPASTYSPWVSEGGKSCAHGRISISMKPDQLLTSMGILNISLIILCN